jgi:Tfp pilus assembly protein PilP
MGKTQPAPRPEPNATPRTEPAEAKAIATASGGRSSERAEPTAVESPVSASVSFKPLGYVQKAGGQVEAIVSQDDQVYIVHQGDLFAGKYRVLKISPESVEAIDETIEQAGLRSAPQPPREAASKQPTSRASNKLSASARENPPLVARQDKPERPVALPTAAQMEQIPTDHAAMSAAQPLGYVERADGRVETVMADGEHVRLVQQAAPDLLARSTHPSHLAGIASTIPPATGRLAPVGPRSVQVAETSALPGAASRGGPARAIRAVSFTPSRPSRPQATMRGVEPIPARTEMRPSPTHRQMADGSAGVSRGEIQPAGFMGSGPRVRPTVPVGPPILMKTIGFVEKADGELDAVLSLADDVYIVRQGDWFAGRYRAVKISREVVEAVEEVPHDGLSPPLAHPPPVPDLLSFAIQDGRPPPQTDEVRADSGTGQRADLRAVTPTGGLVWANLPPSARQDRRPRRRVMRFPNRDRAGPAGEAQVSAQAGPFVFQALGYVKTAKGALEAIVADGARVYLVRQGEFFADHYRAVSVDPAMVLAVRAPPGHDGEESLSRSTDAGTPASKKVYGVLCLLPSESANPNLLRDTGVSGATRLTRVGSNLLGSLAFAGFDLQSHLGLADNRSDGN